MWKYKIVKTLIETQILWTNWLKFKYAIEYIRYEKSDNNFEKPIIKTAKTNYSQKNRLGFMALKWTRINKL